MISIVICTYNPDLKIFKRVIDAIGNQSDKNFEFIIIDNNSSFSISDLDFVKNSHAKVLREGIPGLTAARKRATIESSNDLIIFIDDDNVISSNYVENAKEIMSNNNQIAVISGLITPEYQSPPPSWVINFEEMLAIRKKNISELRLTNDFTYNYTFPIGAGMVIRKNIMESYFQEISNGKLLIEGRIANELTSGEDTDICFFAISKGYYIGISSLLKLTHIIPLFRVQIEYLLKLAPALLQSNYLINSKWKPVIGKNIFKDFDKSKLEVFIRLVYYSLVRTKSNQIKHKYFLKLLSLLNK
ncbi:hypothetical protein EMA8858_02881 [Emticicia aquatica]|uniref:Glycosyltransferase 2-like domain-containing protein n=1 Tax=Emticicia aquatica TaxID=1681835 RepID=A0ABN8EZH8_9BACT|nr:glycosyltransferase [Emticicia aquatica]CAH0996746.1 hypothetical protein EMA8858_02881 [Emticicia aquatica]